MNITSEDSINQINDLFSIKVEDTYEKHIIPDMICKALIQKGPLGLKCFEKQITSELRYIFFSSIICNLWLASKGKI